MKGADARTWRRWRQRQDLRQYRQFNLETLAAVRQDNERFLTEQGVQPTPFSVSTPSPSDPAVWGTRMALLALDELAAVLGRNKKSVDVQEAVYYTLLVCGMSGDYLQLVSTNEERRRTSRVTATKQGEETRRELAPRRAWVMKHAREILQNISQWQAFPKGWKKEVAQQIAALSRRVPEGKQLYAGVENRFRTIYRDDIDEAVLRAEFGAPAKRPRQSRRKRV
jgi:hypothetical protein